MPNSESRLPVATFEPSPRHGVPQPAAAIDARARIDSADLLRGGRELLIAHAGEEYRLRLTRNNKLILTK
ncbi:hemin uptake protein HemP [Dokdonella sp.]|uniref:hemin uptake protein HemP n=1 Tax=Dokdonella sp. TaxID=2291710 RepID=UPI002B71A29C|nr:hemin uptake protein HemP [Dokdonella sp.]HOX71855.1 hemin uptake protein HemP [Dokdonella sp.]HPN78334.1 hemin uptake protein HemP [Dokdonella sp.]